MAVWKLIGQNLALSSPVMSREHTGGVNQSSRDLGGDRGRRMNIAWVVISKANLNHGYIVKELPHILNKICKAKKVNLYRVSGDMEKRHVISRQTETRKASAI